MKLTQTRGSLKRFEALRKKTEGGEHIQQIYERVRKRFHSASRLGLN